MSNNGQEEILLLRNGTISTIKYTSMRDGILGTTLEDALQRILAEYPQVIPGRQVDPSASEPPRFALLKREKSISDWSLDLLLVDQYATPTLIEAKLYQNPQSRREVIGQIIEYAANAVETWGAGKAREDADDFWRKKGLSLRQCLVDELAIEDDEKFWSDFEDNLRNGKMRLIIAADILRPEVRRMIEFLNERLEEIDILGLELKCFTADNSDVVFVPQIVGQSQRTSDNKSKPTPWPKEKLFRCFEDIDDESLKTRMHRLLKFATENTLFKESTSKTPMFLIHDGTYLIQISFGRCYFGIGHRKGKASEGKTIFYNALVQIGMITNKIKSADSIPDGTEGRRLIGDLTDDEFEKFFSAITAFFGHSKN